MLHSFQPSSIKESLLGSGSPTDYFATYASIPQYISTDVRCLFMENSEYMSFDMTQADRVSIRLESDKMRGIYIYIGKDWFCDIESR